MSALLDPQVVGWIVLGVAVVAILAVAVKIGRARIEQAEREEIDPWDQ